MARLLVAALVLFAQSALAQSERVLTLTLTHTLGAREEARLRVDAGIMAKGVEIAVYTGRGEYVGTISPFGIREGQIAGGYTFPLRAGMFHDGRITLVLTARQYGQPPRAPTQAEVENVALRFYPKPDRHIASGSRAGRTANTPTSRCTGLCR
jgi:hypothetical protein